MHYPPTAVSAPNGRFMLRAISVLVALTAAVTCPVSAIAAQAKNKPLPEFPVIEKVVEEHFAELRGYKPGDILTRRDVTPLFAKLEKQGWKVADQAAILDSLLTDHDSLVRELRSRNGRPFMRQIGRLPEGYDRLDRLRKMPYGERRIRELIRNPGGWTMIAYMTTTPYGRNLSKQVARGRNGQNFDKATGRLYTAKDVLARLKKSHETELKRRAGKQQPK